MHAGAVRMCMDGALAACTHCVRQPLLWQPLSAWVGAAEWMAARWVCASDLRALHMWHAPCSTVSGCSTAALYDGECETAAWQGR